MTDWCILRTKGSSTLRLARSLGLDGYDTWTPTEIQVKRAPKSRARTETMVAVMPTWVFAQADRISDLSELSQIPNMHPDFSVFSFYGRYPLVAQHELAALRAIERKAAAERKPVVFPAQTPVRTPEGPFQGLTGQVVETSKGEFTLVAFPGFNIPVKFASWKLEKAA